MMNEEEQQDYMDHVLIQKARNGDKAAFSRIITKIEPSLYKTARAILNNDEDAADAIQNAILSCWTKIGTLKEDRYSSAISMSRMLGT